MSEDRRAEVMRFFPRRLPALEAGVERIIASSDEVGGVFIAV